MWETFEEDVARMKSDGLTGYRMSLEWSRLFPDGGGTSHDCGRTRTHVNAANGGRYREMFTAFCERLEFVSLVTLNHYTLPLWC